MDAWGVDREQQSAEHGLPAALLECLAAMRIGAEAAFEWKLAGTVEQDPAPKERE